MLEVMKRMLALLMTLTAGALVVGCDHTTLQPPSAGDPPLFEIKGKVFKGTGTGTLQTFIGGASSLPLDAQVNANGQFKVELPAGEELSEQLLEGANLLESVGCKGQIISSNPEAKGTGFVSFQMKRGQVNDTIINGEAKINLLPPSGELSAQMYLFANQASTLKGVVDCAKVINVPEIQEVEVQVDAPVRQGWNVLHLNVSTELKLPIRATGSLKTVRAQDSIWLTTQQIRDVFPF